MRSIVTRDAVTRGTFMLSAGLSLLLAAAATADAQTIWNDHARPQSLWLEFNHVEFDGEGSGFLTSSNVLGGRYYLDDVTALTAELPFAYADLDTPFDSEFGVGSPYLGVEHSPTDRFLLEAGLRLPFSATNNGAAAGFFAEYADRSAAYLDEVLSVQVIPNLLTTYEGGFRTRLRGGPVVWIPTGGGAPQLLIDYGGAVGFENARFGGDLGITGWMLVSGGDLDFGERTVFQVGAQAYRRFGSGGRLGVLLRIPLDDAVENVDFTLGVAVSMPVG